MSRVASSRRAMKIFWLVAVLCFLCTAIYEVYSTVHEYLQFPTVVKIREDVVRTRENMPPPQITICNNNPFPSNSRQLAIDNNITFYDDFRVMFTNFKNCHDCTVDQRSLVETYTRGLSSLNAYYQFIGEAKATQIGHKQESLIAGCEALDMNGFGNFNRKECSKDLVLTSIVLSPDNFNCYEYFIDHIKQIPIDLQLYFGFGLVIYLDSPDVGGDYYIDHQKIPLGAKVMYRDFHNLTNNVTSILTIKMALVLNLLYLILNFMHVCFSGVR